MGASVAGFWFGFFFLVAGGIVVYMATHEKNKNPTCTCTKATGGQIGGGVAIVAGAWLLVKHREHLSRVWKRKGSQSNGDGAPAVAGAENHI